MRAVTDASLSQLTLSHACPSLACGVHPPPFPIPYPAPTRHPIPTHYPQAREKPASNPFASPFWLISKLTVEPFRRSQLDSLSGFIASTMRPVALRPAVTGKMKRSMGKGGVAAGGGEGAEGEAEAKPGPFIWFGELYRQLEVYCLDQNLAIEKSRDVLQRRLVAEHNVRLDSLDPSSPPPASALPRPPFQSPHALRLAPLPGASQVSGRLSPVRPQVERQRAGPHATGECEDQLRGMRRILREDALHRGLGRVAGVSLRCFILLRLTVLYSMLFRFILLRFTVLRFAVLLACPSPSPLSVLTFLCLPSPPSLRSIETRPGTDGDPDVGFKPALDAWCRANGLAPPRLELGSAAWCAKAFPADIKVRLNMSARQVRGIAYVHDQVTSSGADANDPNLPTSWYLIEALTVAVHLSVCLPPVLVAVYTMYAQNFYSLYVCPPAASGHDALHPLTWLDVFTTDPGDANAIVQTPLLPQLIFQESFGALSAER